MMHQKGTTEQPLCMGREKARAPHAKLASHFATFLPGQRIGGRVSLAAVVKGSDVDIEPRYRQGI